MQQVTGKPRRDPAPSRLAYRLHRLMLTPVFRFALRAGIPFALVTLYFADQDRRDSLAIAVNEVKTAIETRPEFMVELMAIDGAGVSLDEDIREVLSLDFPVSSFDLDLDHIRTAIAELDPVKTAAVRVKPGGVLQVTVAERTPVVLWRGPQGLEMLDENGARIRPADQRADHPELPMIAGEGADQHVPEARAILAAAAPLRDRLRGLERLGERRWDLVLDRGQRILLPEDQPVRALERVIALDQAQELLNRDVAAVDMRLTQRPTLRMNNGAFEELWRIRETQAGDAGQ